MAEAPLPAGPAPVGGWPLAALLLGSALLAFGPLLVRLSDTGPIASAFWRMALAAPVLLAIAWARRNPGTRLPAHRLPLGVAALAGAFFAADLAVWHLGIVRTSMANATLFANTTAFMLAGWAILVRGERPSQTRLRALLLALAGAALLMGASARLSPASLAGDLLSLAAAAFYTGYLLSVIRLRDRFPTATVLGLSTAASALFLLPAALLEPDRFWPIDWRPVVALAVSSQLAGQGLMVFASGRLPAFVVGVGLLVQPLVSAITGWLVFGETLGPVALTGALMIGVALILVRR